MVEAAEADVVGPAVAADDPHALAAQVVGQLAQRACLQHGLFFQFGHRLRHAFALFEDTRLAVFVGQQDRLDQRLSQHRRQALQQRDGVGVFLVHRGADAEAEFGVVFEQGVVPGRAAALAGLGPWRDRQVAAVDGGAAGGVGDDHAIAE